MAIAFVNFRGDQWEVEYWAEYSPEIGVDGVTEWGFVRPDAPTPTPEEEQGIMDQLYEAWNAPADGW
jgi:hypothetical protein